MQIKFEGKNEGKEQSDKLKTEKEIHKDGHKEVKEKEKDKDKEKEKDKDKEHLKEQGKEFGKELYVGEHLPFFMQAAVTQVPVTSAEAASAVPMKIASFEKHPEKWTKYEYEKHFLFDKTHKIEKEKVEIAEYGLGQQQAEPGGGVEQRLNAVEAALAQLVHFIPQELRPDLSKGALKQEPPEANPEPPATEKQK